MLKKALAHCAPPRLRELWLLLLAATVIAADQLTKWLISSSFFEGQSKVFIPGILNFHYILNDAAAFGLFGDFRIVFMSVTCLVVAAGVIMLCMRFFRSGFISVAATLVVAGGIGNLIDRFSAGEVVDFLEFAFINFAIFNIADSAVVIGAFMLIVYYLLDMVRESRQKNREPAGISTEGTLPDAGPEDSRTDQPSSPTDG